MFTAPLALLPEGAARAAWGLLQLAALWGLGWALLWWLAKLPPSAWAAPHWVLVASAVLLSRYLLATHTAEAATASTRRWRSAGSRSQKRADPDAPDSC